MDFSSEQNSMGPDYFGFYAREVAELISQSEDHLPCSSNNPDVGKHDRTGNGITGSIGSGPTFCDAVGFVLSHNKKERLRAILKQSVVILSQEVDEIFDPVINMGRLKSWIRQERSSSHRTSATCEKDVDKHPRKKPKLCSSSTSLSLPLHASPTRKGSKNVEDEQKEELNEDIRILLDDVGEERIRKHSDDLSTTLGCMQQKLEELLDIVMSTCRPMTHVEKDQLGRLIKNLPPENLSRVVEILHPRNPLEKKSLEGIEVNLEHEAIHTATCSYKDNTTLWRLYYYVRAFENAKKLRPKSISRT